MTQEQILKKSVSPVLKKNVNSVLKTNPVIEAPLIHLPDQYRVFCVDDDPMIRIHLRNTLKANKNIHVSLFESGEQCIKSLYQKPDIVILDFHLSNLEDNSTTMNGLGILEKIKELSPDSKMIMLSSQDKIEVAVRCLKKGATDYIIKDDKMTLNIKKSIDSIVKSIELKSEITELSQKIKRDKLLMKGYFILTVALVFLSVFLLLRN